MKRSLAICSLVGAFVGLLASSVSLTAAIAVAAPATSPELMPFTGSLRISRTWGEPSGGYHPYPAIDIGMSVGTPIYAAGTGVIVFVRNDARSCDPSMHATIPGSDQSGITWCIDNGFGNAGVWTEIKHPDGTFSLYGHLSALAAGTILGASVSAGQQIGLSGNTGITTGPHLHYEERNAAGAAIDPGKWVTCQGGSRTDYIDVQHLVGQTVRNDDYACIGSTTKPPPLPKPGTNALTSMAPARLLETRPELATSDNLFNNLGIRPAGSVTYLQVAGRAGVPADATAAVLNITVTNPRSDGFITVYPCGSPLPNASNLNYTTNQTTPNAVIAKIGDNGQVCIYTLAATHLITDINGYFPS
jgi:hypothetical protein